MLQSTKEQFNLPDYNDISKHQNIKKRFQILQICCKWNDQIINISTLNYNDLQIGSKKCYIMKYKKYFLKKKSGI